MRPAGRCQVSVESGRLASLVITDGPLFDSETAIVETWVAGERFEFASEPQRDATGTWTLKVAAPPKDFPSDLTVSIKSSDKLSGEIGVEKGVDKQRVDIGRLVLNGTCLSATF